MALDRRPLRALPLINPALGGSFVDRSATGRRAADAPFLVGVQRRFVVDGDFLAGRDVA